jgi:hypothetical protein
MFTINPSLIHLLWGILIGVAILGVPWLIVDRKQIVARAMMAMTEVATLKAKAVAEV